MKITKRQLKRIIREEYSKLKRRGLILENAPPESAEKFYRKIEKYFIKNEKLRYDGAALDGGDALSIGETATDGKWEIKFGDDVIAHADRGQLKWAPGTEDIEKGFNNLNENKLRLTKRQLKRIIREEYSRLRSRPVITEGIGSTILVEIEELLLDELGDDIDAKISMAKAIALIKSNMPYVMKGQSAKDIEDFIYSHNEFYHDIVIDPISRSVMLKQIFDDDDETISSPYHYSDSPIHVGSVGVKAGRNPFPGEY